MRDAIRDLLLIDDELAAESDARVSAALAHESNALTFPTFSVEEAIRLKYGRPVAFIQDDRVGVVDSTVWAKRVEAARPRVEPAFRSIGQIQPVGHPEPDTGTGWIVAPGVIVTNRHIARIFAESGGAYSFKQFPAGACSARVDFQVEHDQRAAAAPLPITRVLWIASDTEPDIAFLAVDGLDGRDALRLATALPRSPYIAAVGYPLRDPERNDAADMDRIFGRVYGVKRFAPGWVRGEVSDTVLDHDCTTLGGSSGSVLLSLDTGEAVGIHFKGRFLEFNHAVNAWTIARHLGAILPA